MRVREGTSSRGLSQSIVPDRIDFGPSRRIALGQGADASEPLPEPLKAEEAVGPRGPYVVSAYVDMFTAKGREYAPNVAVDVFDQKTGLPVARKKTDKDGVVFFDLSTEYPYVVMKVVAPEGHAVYPAQATRESFWGPKADPAGPNFLRKWWDWSDSAKFLIMKKGEEPPKEGEGKEPEGFFTIKNIIIIGGIAVVGYFLYRALSGGD